MAVSVTCFLNGIGITPKVIGDEIPRAVTMPFCQLHTFLPTTRQLSTAFNADYRGSYYREASPQLLLRIDNIVLTRPVVVYRIGMEVGKGLEIPNELV